MEFLQASDLKECADPDALPADISTCALAVLFGAGVSMAADRKWERGAKQRSEPSVKFMALNR